MKKLVFVCILLANISHIVSAQENKFGLKAGLNFAILSGTVNMDPVFRKGLAIGGYGDFTISDVFHLQPEMIFSSQGAGINYFHGSQNVGESTTKLSYLNIPLMGKFFVGELFNLQIGPQLGFLLAGKNEGAVNGNEIDEDLKEIFNRADFGINFGLGFDLPNNIDLDARLNYGLSDVSNQPKELGYGLTRPALNNRVVQLTVGYTFDSK